MDSYIRGNIPAFLEDYVREMRFALSWADNSFPDFDAWKQAARQKALELIMYDPPQVKFALEVIAEEDCGEYTRQKITFAATPWYRIPAYLLIPHGEGPFPAVVACHDHGAYFYYGKEKLVETEHDANPSLAQFKQESYGGRSIASELARRGYVVICTDALFWGERAVRGTGEEELELGSIEGVREYNQRAYQSAGSMTANLMNAGIGGWCSVLLRDDLRTAEFLSSLPLVDPSRIGSCGLSVGCFRSWHLAALSDLIQASVNVCWMTDIRSQLLERCNLTTSPGSFSMTIPGIFQYLDYPDFAALACPKPTLFYSGRQDTLFPTRSIEHAYAKMRQVWESQGAGDSLITKLWDTPHEFNGEMQDEAFDWLGERLNGGGGTPKA